ncbi:MAG: NAD-dependent epimerase/dehydratase family protein [Acidobacteriota bacterium]
MKILITGGTGFLGRTVVQTLAPAHALRLLVRPTSSRERFPDGVEFAVGDVTDQDSLARAAVGCDAVVHAAALVKILAPPADFDRINVVGLENVLAATTTGAAATTVRHVVYVSSFMALGPTENSPDGMLDESAPVDDRDWINDYERTKTLADRAARAAIESGAPLSVSYPGVVYGPGELTEGNILVRHILDLAHGRLPALLGEPQRRWNYVYVQDVADGIARILDAAPGGRYMLGGDNVTQDRLYALIRTLAGIDVPTRRMPDWLAGLAGGAMKLGARLTGGTPKLTPDLVEVYRHDWAYSSAHAMSALGYAPRTLEQGLGLTLDWLRETPEWPTRR